MCSMRIVGLLVVAGTPEMDVKSLGCNFEGLEGPEIQGLGPSLQDLGFSRASGVAFARKLSIQEASGWW